MGGGSGTEAEDDRVVGTRVRVGVLLCEGFVFGVKERRR